MDIRPHNIPSRMPTGYTGHYIQYPPLASTPSGDASSTDDTSTIISQLIIIGTFILLAILAFKLLLAADESETVQEYETARAEWVEDTDAVVDAEQRRINAINAAVATGDVNVVAAQARQQLAEQEAESNAAIARVTTETQSSGDGN